MAKKKPNKIPRDIPEDFLKEYYPECLNLLLKDHTTSIGLPEIEQENIYWATDSYNNLGNGFYFYDPITVDKITGEYGKLISPRVDKDKTEQAKRVKDKAEVFTPSWVCNAQNNLVDEAWFGRPDVFNRPDPDNPHQWIDTEGDIIFPDTEGKTWKDYVAARRMEITCGEAPYLVSRYDTVSGEFIHDVRHRIGLLDRKLIVVTQHTTTTGEWLLWAKIALRATYGFEWQGDNLLLAREALLFTFVEHYNAKFKKWPSIKELPGAAYIISWNIWQMDGLTFGLPGHNTKELTDEMLKAEQAKPKQMELFAEASVPETIILPKERLCRIKDFIGKINIHNPKLTNRSFKDRNTRQQKFIDVINENRKI